MNDKALVEVGQSAYPLIEFSVTAEVLAKLTEQFAGITEITEDNYETIKAGVQKMTKLRTGIETHRNELLGDARQFTADVNDEAKRVTALVAAIEDPVKKLKTDHDSKVKAEKDAEKVKEKARTDAINGRIDSIERCGQDLDGKTAAELRVILGDLESDKPLEPDYQEFHAVALERWESSCARIEVAALKAVAREIEAAQLKEAQEALAKEKAEAAEKQKVIDDKLATEREEFEEEKRQFAAKQKEDADAAQKVIDDAAAETAQAEQEQRDKEIAEAAATAALEENARLEAEATAAEEEARQMAPDRDKLARFAELVTATAEAAPELEHDKARKLLARAVKSLVDISGNLASQSENL